MGFARRRRASFRWMERVERPGQFTEIGRKGTTKTQRHKDTKEAGSRKKEERRKKKEDEFRIRIPWCSS
jgi:hypothetical protein